MNRGVQEVRIVGGSLRGRKLAFPDAPGLRPTPDRVRETLFNWLAPHIGGMRVLDLFAGSGALGIEAMSRGAAQCGTGGIQPGGGKTAARVSNSPWPWQCARGSCGCDWPALKRAMSPGGEGPFDLIFLDPPFDSGLQEPALKLIARSGCPGARRVLLPRDPAPGRASAAARWLDASPQRDRRRGRLSSAACTAERSTPEL